MLKERNKEGTKTHEEAVISFYLHLFSTISPRRDGFDVL